jgi:hypothetical protein
MKEIGGKHFCDTMGEHCSFCLWTSQVRAHLHDTFTIKPIPMNLHRLTANFFAHCPTQPNPLVKQIGNYAIADLTNMFKKCKDKWPKHILL